MATRKKTSKRPARKKRLKTYTETLYLLDKPVYVSAIIMDPSSGEEECGCFKEEGYLARSSILEDYLCLSHDINGLPFITFCEGDLHTLIHSTPPETLAEVRDIIHVGKSS